MLFRSGKKGFVKTVVDLRKMFNFEVLAILEPRISGDRACKVMDKLGFTDRFVVEASGFPGGIWLLWNASLVKLKVVASSKHSISAVVADGSNFWVLTIVYANPCATIRRCIWDYLSAIRNCFFGP